MNTSSRFKKFWRGLPPIESKNLRFELHIYLLKNEPICSTIPERQSFKNNIKSKLIWLIVVLYFLIFSLVKPRTRKITFAAATLVIGVAVVCGLHSALLEEMLMPATLTS